MSKQVALAVERRDGSGKGEARALRRAGRVPAIAYGSGLDATPLSVDERELFHALHTDAGTNAIFRLAVDGDTHLALAREIHRHPVRRDILHVDFVTVDRNRKVTVDVPVVLQGEAPGADEGGVIEQQQYTVHVEVLPLEVPAQITLDVSDMNVGDVKRIADLSLPEGVSALDDPERTVVTLVVPALDVPAPVAGEPGEGAAEVALEGEAAETGAAEVPEEGDAPAGAKEA